MIPSRIVTIKSPYLPKPVLPPVEKKKQRTISTDHTELQTYIAGKRVGPPQIQTSAIPVMMLK